LGDLGPRGIWQVWDNEKCKIFEIRDIVFIIVSYCDDMALLKLTMLSKELRTLLLH